jgi:hypothetical protein
VTAGVVTFVVQEVASVQLSGSTCEDVQDTFVGALVGIRAGVVARALAAHVTLAQSQVSVSLTSCGASTLPDGRRLLTTLQGTVTTVITGLSYSAGLVLQAVPGGLSPSYLAPLGLVTNLDVTVDSFVGAWGRRCGSPTPAHSPLPTPHSPHSRYTPGTPPPPHTHVTLHFCA